MKIKEIETEVTPVVILQKIVPPETNLATRLLNVMAEVGTINKGGRNDHNGYTYVRESDVVKRIQELLVKHGIFITSSVIKSETRQITNSKGNLQVLASVDVQYTLINVDTPAETLQVIASGDGLDVGDKAIYKASTGAHKYFLIRNFNLGSHEDPENDSEEAGKDISGIAKAQSKGDFF